MTRVNSPPVIESGPRRSAGGWEGVLEGKGKERDMNFQVALLTIGVLLFLSGLIGKIDAQLFKVGTTNKVTRFVLGSMGLLFIGLSFLIERPISFKDVSKDMTERDLESLVAIYKNEGEMYDAALKAYDEGDYTKAFSLFMASAERGYDLSQTYIGDMYRLGQGTERDEKKAIEWYRKAANQGQRSAQMQLGDMYRKGQGVSKDEREAFKWYRVAAEQHLYEYAQIKLGDMYRLGQGVEKDEKEAIHWYTLAAEQGNAEAQTQLGHIYRLGQGVKRDEDEAIKWYRRAAEQNYWEAQNILRSLQKGSPN
jgi:TPR repeat protein